MEGDTEANGKLQVFKAEVEHFKPLIDEVVDDCYVKERQIVEDFCFFFALDQLLKSVICKIFIAGQINGVISQNSSSSQFLAGGLQGHLYSQGLGDA